MKTLIIRPGISNLLPKLLYLLPLLAIIYRLFFYVDSIHVTLADFINNGILQLAVLALLFWLLLIVLSKLLADQLYPQLFAKLILNCSTPHQELTLWQHYVLQLAFYALLVCSATGCIIGIC